MNRLPTFIKDALDDYSRHRTVDDEYARYKSLENAYAITIKYVGTTLALIAADYFDDDDKAEVWSAIFRSSGLGGWLAGARMVCKNSKKLPDDARQYCREYTLYKQHPNVATLDDVSAKFVSISKQLHESYGYRLGDAGQVNIIRALEFAVELRNKSAHGALKVTFFNRVEDLLFSALKQLLDVVSFQPFVFFGKYGRSNAISFLEPGSIVRRRREAHFWAESPLLKDGYSDQVPFISYNEDSRSISFLNSAVEEGEAEYIDYRTGAVRYNEVVQTVTVVDIGDGGGSLRPRNYRRHSEILATAGLTWEDVALSSSGMANANARSGVYVFVTDVQLGTETLEVILYVGKTRSLRQRLRQYVRIKRGYDTSRSEMSAMFRIYGNSVRMRFAMIDEEVMDAVERAIYETTMPEYNLIAPTDGRPEGEDE